MEKFVIHGGRPLVGEIEISGEHAAQIVELMNFRDCMLLAAVKRAVINALTVEES